MAPADQVRRYIDGVESGKLATGRLVKLAVRRHLLDLKIAGRRGLHFDADKASSACEFFSCLKHTTGEYSGHAFDLRDWQAFIIWTLHGWQTADNLRRFRDAFVSLGRGNGKSPLAAGEALQLTFCDQPIEPRAEGYCFATKREQARKTVFNEASRMVMNSSFKDVIEVLKYALNNNGTQSHLEPLASEGGTTDGLVPHVAILDELHEWRDRELYDKIVTAMGKRRQPLMFQITTAGNDQSHLWREIRDNSIKVLEQVENPPADDEWFGDDQFAYIAEVDEKDDIYDESNWPKANPMLLDSFGPPVSVEHIRSLTAKAKAGDAAAETQVRRYHFNQLVASELKPLTSKLWANGNAKLRPLDPEQSGFAAIDLAQTHDLAAVGLVRPWEDDEGNQNYDAQCWCWTVERRSESLENDPQFMRLLGRADNLFVLPGARLDGAAYALIREFLLDLRDRVWIRSVCYDRRFAEETAHNLSEQDFEMVAFAQNAANYNEPVSRFIDELGAGRVHHGNDPLLRWQAGNLVVESNAQGLVMPSRAPGRRGAKAKIDGIVTCFMAFREAMLHGRDSGPGYDMGEPRIF